MVVTDPLTAAKKKIMTKGVLFGGGGVVGHRNHLGDQENRFPKFQHSGTTKNGSRLLRPTGIQIAEKCTDFSIGLNFHNFLRVIPRNSVNSSRRRLPHVRFCVFAWPTNSPESRRPTSMSSQICHSRMHRSTPFQMKKNPRKEILP